VEQSEEKEERVDDGEETDEEKERRGRGGSGGKAHEGVSLLSPLSLSLSLLFDFVSCACSLCEDLLFLL